MLPPNQSPAEFELRQRREEIRRSLSRVNTAGVAVVLVTIALAGAAAVGALRATQQTELARQANEVGREQLWKSYLAQARAGRLSREVGSKASGLEAIALAAAIRASIELRNEAISHLAMLDFAPTALTWTNSPKIGHSFVDPKLERFFESDGYGNVRISRVNERTNAFVLRSANAAVHAASFSADGRLLSVVHLNRRLVVWDLGTRTNAYVIEGVTWARFSPSRDLLVALMSDDSVRVLDPASGRELARCQPGGRPGMATFDSTGDQVAVVMRTKLKVWNWKTGKLGESYQADSDIWSVAWQGPLLATGEKSGEVRIWSLLTNRSRRLQAHQNGSHHIFFSPAGDLLVSTSYDGSTKVWDPRTGQLLLNTGQGFAVQFSPGGERILFITQSGYSIWSVQRPIGITLLDCVTGPAPNVWHTDFSRDGRWLSATKEDGVCVFEVETGRRVFFQSMNQSRGSYFLPDGTNLLTTSTHRIAYWPITAASTGSNASSAFGLGPRELIPLTNYAHIEPGALSLDRKQLVLPMNQTEAALFDLETRREVRRFTNAILPKLSSISPDQRWVATGTFHGRGMAVWDAASGQMLCNLRDGNTSAFFSPDGKFLLGAGSSHYRIYEPGTWKLLHQIPRESGSDLPNLAAFNSDGRLMAAIKQLNRIELLATDSWKLIVSLIPPDPQVVTWPAFSADDRYLAVATGQDLVQLWDLKLIRTHLAKMGLDWDSSSPPAPLVAGGSPNIPRIGQGQRWVSNLILPISVGVLVVLICAVFIRHRQRRLLAAYMEVDQRAEAQKHQLALAQTELIHSQKMKALGTLAAGIAHDFNNLLSVIRMSNQLTGEETPGNASVQENVSEIEQAVGQGKRVVRSMLGYSRDGTGPSGAVALPELVEDTVALLTRQFLNGITLTLELDHDLPPVPVSRHRLEQIVLNLIVNASEAMKGQGTLKLSAHRGRSGDGLLILRPRAPEELVELTVRDSGPGIEPAILPRIFEPFFTTKDRGATRGTGLGLSTIYTMAEQDGLGINVKSELGQGAEFRIIIPVKPA